jgi:3-oxoadipate enol-lactonase
MGCTSLFAAGRVRATIEGDGPPLVLLHSLLSDSGSFELIRAPLAKHHRVIIPDLPGFGGSELVSGGLAAVADRMAQAVREAAGKERPVILGNGYGGFIALQMTIRHPDIADRLVLADSGAAFSEPGRAAFRAMASVSAQKGLEAVADTAMRRLFSPEFQDNSRELMQERRAAFLRTDANVFRAACEALAELDLRTKLKSVAIPVLVLVGEKDEATPPPMSEELATSLPKARLMVLSGCAHVPQLQAPRQFLDALIPFLTQTEIH